MVTDGRAHLHRNPLTVRVLLGLGRRGMKVPFRVLSVVLGLDIAMRDYGDMMMPHPVGIVLHRTMIIGRGVTIYQNVTVASHPRSNQAATIADNVVICAGAVLVGPVKIGAGATIAANAVVTSDVPPGVTAAGIPARPVQSNRFGSNSE